LDMLIIWYIYYFVMNNFKLDKCYDFST